MCGSSALYDQRNIICIGVMRHRFIPVIPFSQACNSATVVRPPSLLVIYIANMVYFSYVFRVYFVKVQIMSAYKETNQYY